MDELSDNGKRFAAANKIHPVVRGSVIGLGGQGCRYTLSNGETFRLSSTDCKLLGKPVWAGP